MTSRATRAALCYDGCTIKGRTNIKMPPFLLYAALAPLIGFLLDLLIGDPRGWPHLIRAFGYLINRLEQRLYPAKNKRLAGLLLVMAVLFCAACLPALLLWVAWRISPILYLLLESLLCWQLLAARSLKDESLPVYTALKQGDRAAARTALSMIVGRDTALLDEAGIIRATVETVAENTADGVAAPMLHMALGGAVLGCLYKAANTMDSMIGYRNERYLDFGRAAALLDDWLNYLPARLCALTMIVAAHLCGLDARNAWRVYRRDRRKHQSPNSAQTEAVMAGALGIQLAGDAVYQGRLVEKPTIGDAIRPVEAADILQAHRLLYASSWLLLGLSIALRGLIYAAL